MNALKHGMTARVIVLPHEDEIEYHEICAALLESYAPANAHETMLVDQVAAGYWRTLRSRRLETALLTEGARTYKQNHGKSTEPNAGHDDSVCAVWMVEMREQKLRNYFRYDGSIERQYYRAIAALEKAQAARFGREQQLERILRNAPPDTIAELSPEPPPPTPAAAVSENGIGSVSSQQDESCKTSTAALGDSTETRVESSFCILEKSDAGAGSDASIALRPCCSVVPACTPKCQLDCADSDTTRKLVGTPKGAWRSDAHLNICLTDYSKPGGITL